MVERRAASACGEGTGGEGTEGSRERARMGAEEDPGRHSRRSSGSTGGARRREADARRRGSGGEVARTRAGGIHRVGTYAQGGQRRGAPVEWEAGDVKRGRIGGTAQRSGTDNAEDGARRK